MQISRIYQSVSLQSHAVIQLDEAASHHIARVLRAKVQEPVVIFNGEGGEYPGIITHIDKKTVTVQLQEFNAREAESPLELYLAQGISRGDKMDYTIQKAVELGVKQIFPVFTERCNVKLDAERREKRREHWQSVVISACEQSGRNRVPLVAVPQPLTTLSQVPADWRLLLSPHVQTPLQKYPIQKNQRIMLLIGPEGGLSAAEVKWAEQQGFSPLNLGPRVLRTETAALAAIAALQSYFGDF